MLYHLGALRITVAPFNVDSVDRTAGADFAEKSVIGAEPTLEPVGEGANTWRLKGGLFPERIGGLSELEILDRMRLSQLPQDFVRGDGKPLGWVVVTRVNESSSYLDAQGVGRKIGVSISIRRASGPARGDFFSIMMGLF